MNAISTPTGQRASIGQASVPTKTKNGLNGSSINAHFRKKGFYSAYTLFDPDDDDDRIRDGLDPNPGTSGDNACNSAVAVPIEFTNQAITTTVQCAARVKVTVKSTTHVMGMGNLQIITPEIIVEPSVKVDPGGKLSLFSEKPPD